MLPRYYTAFWPLAVMRAIAILIIDYEANYYLCSRMFGNQEATRVLNECGRDENVESGVVKLRHIELTMSAFESI